MLLAGFGLIFLWRKNILSAVLTAFIFLGDSLGVIYLRKYGWGVGIDYTYRVYYLPAFLMVIVWLAVIIDYLYNFLIGFFKSRSAVGSRIVQIFFIFVLLSLPISFLISDYQYCDQSGFWFNYDYAKNLLMSLPPNSIYYLAYDGSLHADTELFTLVYLKMIERVRPDVSLVSEQNFFYKDGTYQVPKAYFWLDFETRRTRVISDLVRSGRPVYTDFAVVTEISNSKLFGLPNGYAYRVYPDISAAKKAKPMLFSASLRNLDEIDELSDVPLKGLAAHYYYDLAAFYLAVGDKDRSQRYLLTAFDLDVAPLNHEYRRFLIYRTEWLAKD